MISVFSSSSMIRTAGPLPHQLRDSLSSRSHPSVQEQHQEVARDSLYGGAALQVAQRGTLRLGTVVIMRSLESLRFEDASLQGTRITSYRPRRQVIPRIRRNPSS